MKCHELRWSNEKPAEDHKTVLLDALFMSIAMNVIFFVLLLVSLQMNTNLLDTMLKGMP